MSFFEFLGFGLVYFMLFCFTAMWASVGMFCGNNGFPSPLPIKHYWWYAPVWVPVLLAWYKMISSTTILIRFG